MERHGRVHQFHLRKPVPWFQPEGICHFLAGNQLTGYIPPALGNLVNLEVLDLGFNQLSGPIPPELVNLVHLEFLDLGGNPHMSGPIPPEIGDLKILGELFLGDSNLSGSLPAEIGNLTKLRILMVNGNPLEGSLPRSLMNLHSQVVLFDRADLCEPVDPAFQEWLSGVEDLGRTGVQCELGN